jgi:hypothetical protein
MMQLHLDMLLAAATLRVRYVYHSAGYRRQQLQDDKHKTIGPRPCMAIYLIISLLDALELVGMLLKAGLYVPRRGKTSLSGSPTPRGRKPEAFRRCEIFFR